jgi:hypothetical protein
VISDYLESLWMHSVSIDRFHDACGKRSKTICGRPSLSIRWAMDSRRSDARLQISAILMSSQFSSPLSHLRRKPGE